MGIENSPINNPIIIFAHVGIDLPSHDNISLIDHAPIVIFNIPINIIIPQPTFSYKPPFIHFIKITNLSSVIHYILHI